LLAIPRYLLLCLPLAFTLFAAQAGFAGNDTKSYSAAVCQTAGTRQTLDYWWGHVINRSSGTAIADCPIVKDRMTGVSSKYVEFWAIDRSASRNVRCSLYNLSMYALEPWRNVEWVSAETSGSYGQVTKKRMYWGSRSTHIDGSFLFGCSIPGRQYLSDDGGGSGYGYSELVGFKVIENVIGSSYGTDWD